MKDPVMHWFVNAGTTALGKFFWAVVIGVVGCFVIRMMMSFLSAALERSKLEKAAHSLIKTLSKTVLYVLLGLIVASAVGIDVTGIVALASVATLAISLSLQNMLANVIGGFTLLYTHPFGASDYVEIAGQAGTVKEVGIAYTKLVTPDNRLVSIPNSAVVSAQIVNFSVTGTRRVDIAVSASYNDAPQKVIDALLEAAKHEKVLADPAPFAALTSYGDSAISYTLRVWTKTEDYWEVNFAVLTKIKEIFDRQGIEMTYPHLNVHLDK